MSLRTPLARIKGLGSAKHGTGHWWTQRVTSIALIPLVVWFVITILKLTASGESLVSVLTSPFHAVTMLLFLLVSLYHSALGLQVVIEDYVHAECAKITAIILVQFISAVTAVAAIVAIVTFHLLHVGL